MPPFGPTKRDDLVRGLRQCGFVGPIGKGKHQSMVKENLRITIPNPHHGDISRGLLLRILRQAGVDRETWEKI